MVGSHHPQDRVIWLLTMLLMQNQAALSQKQGLDEAWQPNRGGAGWMTHRPPGGVLCLGEGLRVSLIQLAGLGLWGLFMELMQSSVTVWPHF